MYNYITNPQTGRKVSVFGKLGQSIIRNYITQTGGKCCGTGCTKYRKTKEPKCDDQSGCNWVVGSHCTPEAKKVKQTIKKGKTVHPKKLKQVGVKVPKQHQESPQQHQESPQPEKDLLQQYQDAIQGDQNINDLIKHFRIDLVDNDPEKNRQLVKSIVFNFNNTLKHFPDADPEADIEQIINKQIDLNQVDEENVDGFSQDHLVNYLSIQYYVYCAIERHGINLVTDPKKNEDLLFSIFYTWYRNRQDGELDEDDLDEELQEIIFKEFADHGIENKDYSLDDEDKLIKYIKSQY